MLKKGGALLEEFIAGGTSIPGGLAIFDPTEEQPPVNSQDAVPPFKPTCIGAIGVGGVGLPPEDVAVAKVGLDYIRRKIWPDQFD
jgi:hypothetical protein